MRCLPDIYSHIFKGVPFPKNLRAGQNQGKKTPSTRQLRAAHPFRGRGRGQQKRCKENPNALTERAAHPFSLPAAGASEFGPAHSPASRGPGARAAEALQGKSYC